VRATIIHGMPADRKADAGVVRDEPWGLEFPAFAPRTRPNVRQSQRSRADSVGQHHGRNRQQSGGEFQVVQVFAAEVLGEARVQALA
jgi:hypothetical protein